MSVAYPPQPWDLTGRGWITAWSLPGPLPGLPAGVRPVGRLALTMFVDYRPPGQMAYAELLAGVIVRQGRRVGLAITDIWVDSPASRDGGRELWGVPKELAGFRVADRPSPDAGAALRAELDGAVLAEARFRPGRVPGLPLPLRAPAAIAQSMPLAASGTAARPGARTVWTPVAASARSVRPARATWSAPADGPLGWLAGARSRGSVVVDGFAMRFGR
ncbi:acetoacetate decarboxylase family protein [Nocardioides zeae]|uniref:Acetoacetate decarboxylase family protein n=1 Tax=Nocardioides zeae TaxID=1457234 RepID=A0A6P0HDA5_9ACTN|nr:acetoacetate decarboxylase family protein [Nocardioides zeae]